MTLLDTNEASKNIVPNSSPHITLWLIHLTVGLLFLGLLSYVPICPESTKHSCGEQTPGLIAMFLIMGWMGPLWGFTFSWYWWMGYFEFTRSLKNGRFFTGSKIKRYFLLLFFAWCLGGAMIILLPGNNVPGSIDMPSEIEAVGGGYFLYAVLLLYLLVLANAANNVASNTMSREKFNQFILTASGVALFVSACTALYFRSEFAFFETIKMTTNFLVELSQ